MKLTDEQIQLGLDKAYKKAGQNAYFGTGFEAGIKFAQQHSKRLFCFDYIESVKIIDGHHMGDIQTEKILAYDEEHAKMIFYRWVKRVFKAKIEMLLIKDLK